MKMSKVLRRTVEVAGEDLQVQFGPDGLFLRGKGKRSGKVVTWDQIRGLANSSGADSKGFAVAADGDQAEA